MSEATITASTDSINPIEAHPLVKELRTRATHLKKTSYLYLGLILSALLIGGFLFYKLPEWLIEQDKIISRTQQLFVKQGTLQAQLKFTHSSWKNQRKNAAGAVFDNGQKISQAVRFDSLNSVTFLDATTGWAAGDSGTILSTRDGGKTWTAQTSGTDNYLASVTFLDDASTGWAVGEIGTILSTHDGGKNWTAQTSGTDKSLTSVTFLDDATTG